MPTLSQLGRIELIDKENNKARLADLMIDLFFHKLTMSV